MKHIGLMGHSAEGSALCYLSACHAGAALLGAHTHPEMTLSTIAMSASMEAWARGDYESVRAVLARTAERLAAAGCDFFACPDNTAHIALETEGPPLALPGLHIAEIVADVAASRGYRRLGLLGTEWTMAGPVYPRACGRRGLELRVPAAAERARVDEIIFSELCAGQLREASRSEYQRVIARLAEQGCEAVVLGCTEIPLLVTPEVSALPTLDSTRLLAQRSVEVALGRAPLPTWRGGPFERA